MHIFTRKCKKGGSGILPFLCGQSADPNPAGTHHAEVGDGAFTVGVVVAQYSAATVDAALQSSSALLQIEQLRCQRFLKTDLLAVFRTGKPVTGGEASHRAAQPGGLFVGQASQLLPEGHDGIFLIIYFFHGW